MRVLSISLLLFVAMGPGCTPEHCLPRPSEDETPPVLRLEVSFTDAATGRRVTHTLAGSDPARTFRAVASTPVEVTYVASDPEGLRRVQLGVTYQTVAAAGAVRRSPVLEPVSASCPRAELSGTWSAAPPGDYRSLALGAVAENWVGLRAATPTYVVELTPE
ncbi:hypothetical protein GQ464_011390 [Rhodocaloribacter litoris]|uniref:hypothetical protein n=1 Tax=Rhodocaloribacter litoris TaxID=2558931 RepID=UPI00142490B9|nr:hypothetical protein [Rhodocaloribacter litoris]QXD14062.1 hypothetical protein GQ464_011390 [Rhodocaloribacter litoris]